MLRNTGPFNPGVHECDFFFRSLLYSHCHRSVTYLRVIVWVDTSTPTFMNGKRVDSRCDENGRVKTNATLSGTLAGEDVADDVQKTEGTRYLTIPIGGTDAMVSADQLYKSGPGYVRSITCYSDATATAGTIALRDNTAAGAGNILWSFDVLAVAYNTPFTVDLQTPFSGWPLSRFPHRDH